MTKISQKGETEEYFSLFMFLINLGGKIMIGSKLRIRIESDFGGNISRNHSEGTQIADNFLLWRAQSQFVSNRKLYHFDS